MQLSVCCCTLCDSENIVIIHRLSYSAGISTAVWNICFAKCRVFFERRDAAWSITYNISRASNARIKSTISICVRDNGRNSRLLAQVSAACEILKSIALAICLLSHCYCSRSSWMRALSMPDTADTGFHISSWATMPLPESYYGYISASPVIPDAEISGQSMKTSRIDVSISWSTFRSIRADWSQSTLLYTDTWIWSNKEYSQVELRSLNIHCLCCICSSNISPLYLRSAI